jgi:perosamine synthetase
MIPKYRPPFSGLDLLAALVPRRASEAGLETWLAAYYSVRHALLFESARQGLQAVLAALSPAGRAVVPAYNCIAVPEAVTAAGWQPLFADAGPDDVNMTAVTLEASAAGAQVALLTHQFGIPADVDGILEVCRRRGLFVIEDAAAAIGARYRGRLVGSFGDAGIISFHPTKVIGAGRGGAVLTSDDRLAQRLRTARAPRAAVAGSLLAAPRALAWWAATRRWAYSAPRRALAAVRPDCLYQVVAPQPPAPARAAPCAGFVVRLVRRQLERLEGNLAARRGLAAVYAAELTGVAGTTVCPLPEGAAPSWIQFPLFVADKDGCHRHCLRRGVDLSWTFRYNCAAAYGAEMPEAERATRGILGLPTYPGLAPDEATAIARQVRDFCGGRGSS